ncbi:hypothetical protein SKAU_G00245350 [Synaphobranchus kaupii]|uniref:C2H2-type domain-containing protein n=1 Tax=Synaphobranchus kaupii TaxID=118154 RepID=A0A9Q1F222_SYNKA|nr:hypothetical protein SKAU_G00245350 [Synaphobranchus kaupii]
MHPTHLKKGQDPLLSAVRCTMCCNNYHCTYCKKTFVNIYQIHSHIKQHISSAVPYKDVVIVKCGLSCRQSAHFHCCYCQSTIIRRKDLMKHLNSCQNNASLHPVTSPATAPEAASSPIYHNPTNCNHRIGRPAFPFRCECAIQRRNLFNGI